MISTSDFKISNIDYIMVVNREFKIVYNSRYDNRLGSIAGKRAEEAEGEEERNFFEEFPSIDPKTSSVVQCMTTGEMIVKQTQQFTDRTGRAFLTNNVTLPIFREGQIVGIVELTKDLTTANHRSHQWEKNQQPGKSTPSDRRPTTFDQILTINPEMKKCIEKAKLAALNRNPILIYGETGTGKELFAQAMIAYAEKAEKKVVVQNSAAIPETLVESILFGTAKGAYTGAETSKGLFKEADGGILFLDELNALPYHVQGKLLRVVQDGTFRAVGGTKEERVQLKLITAMNVDPMEAIAKNELRKDLFYRLSGTMIYLPPLRERAEDIEYLTEYYMEEFNLTYHKNVKALDENLKQVFSRYAWEGNVRELKHVMEAMVSMSQRNYLSEEDLPIYMYDKINSHKNPEVAEEVTPAEVAEEVTPVEVAEEPALHRQEQQYDLKKQLQKTEREVILAALEKSNGNKAKAANLLGIPRQTLQYRLEKIGLAGKSE